MYLLYYLTGKTGRITYTVPENEFRTPRKQVVLKWGYFEHRLHIHLQCYALY